MHHIREGKHGARSPKQAIAIGLSKARRAGIKLSPPAPGKASAKVRAQAERDVAKGRSGNGREPDSKRSRATQQALRREGRGAASRSALSAQARQSAKSRGARSHQQVAPKAAHTRARRRQRGTVG